jgi:GNAT superfamily N-acetyltransferase
MEIRCPETAQEWEAYYYLRFRELRQPWNQAPGSEKDGLEHLAVHRAAYLDGNTVGVGRLDNVDESTAQIRFMAVSKDFQGKGIGSAIMNHLEDLAWQSDKNRIILHAREIALDFYAKEGYEYVQKSHLLFGEIQHFLMKKEKG